MQSDAVELIEQALRLCLKRGMPTDSIEHTFKKILRRTLRDAIWEADKNDEDVRADALRDMLAHV